MEKQWKTYVPNLGIYQIPRESSSQAENALYGGPDGKILKLADFGLAVTGQKKRGCWGWKLEMVDADGSKSWNMAENMAENWWTFGYLGTMMVNSANLAMYLL